MFASQQSGLNLRISARKRKNAMLLKRPDGLQSRNNAKPMKTRLARHLRSNARHRKKNSSELMLRTKNCPRLKPRAKRKIAEQKPNASRTNWPKLSARKQQFTLLGKHSIPVTAILNAISEHFGVPPEVSIKWIKQLKMQEDLIVELNTGDEPCAICGSTAYPHICDGAIDALRTIKP